MSKLLGISAILLLAANLIFAQGKIFEKVALPLLTSKTAAEKVERLEQRKGTKRWELVMLKGSIVFSIKYKGVFNIFDKDIEFEITEDDDKDVNGVQGYIAAMKGDGYAVLSSSEKGIGAFIWYKHGVYSIEAIEKGFYLVSEWDTKEFAKYESRQDHESRINQYKSAVNNFLASELSPATIKVFVAYTPDVAELYEVSTLISNCRVMTNNSFGNSLITSGIEIVGSAQLTYTESGDYNIDVTRFMTPNDTFLDGIHSLRNQYDADICILLVNTLNANGAVPEGAIGSVRSNAFAVVKASAAVSNYSFAHEIGHLLGCRHDYLSDGTNLPFAYGHGYHWEGILTKYSSSVTF